MDDSQATSGKSANGWTPERRARQAEVIRTWAPWTKSTGPVTAKGKRKSAQNAYKGPRGRRIALRRAVRALLARMV